MRLICEKEIWDEMDDTGEVLYFRRWNMEKY